jgi:hypothetical protein
MKASGVSQDGQCTFPPPPFSSHPPTHPRAQSRSCGESRIRTSTCHQLELISLWVFIYSERGVRGFSFGEMESDLQARAL